MLDRLRWRIAYLVDRLPGQCWSGLADWPLGNSRFPWSPIGEMCRTDVARCGSCYCGKLRSPETVAVMGGVRVGDGS